MKLIVYSLMILAATSCTTLPQVVEEGSTPAQLEPSVDETDTKESYLILLLPALSGGGWLLFIYIYEKVRHGNGKL